MLNKEKHQLIMGQILKDIYTNVSISSLLGFKGGTCAYFLYHLLRFSVDLDFDLFINDKKTQELVFENVRKILIKFGNTKDECIKYNTIFFLLSYGSTDHNIKIEINTRKFEDNVKDHYKLQEYLGILILAAKKDYLFTNKLIALTSRKELAMRDVYDIYFFAKNNWDINQKIIKTKTNKNIKEYLSDCINLIEKIKDNQILQGLGELLDEKEKKWVKSNLKKETIFLLKNYMSVLGNHSL